eukprot:835366-Amphidinium_carterae.1
MERIKTACNDSNVIHIVRTVSWVCTWYVDLKGQHFEQAQAHHYCNRWEQPLQRALLLQQLCSKEGRTCLH